MSDLIDVFIKDMSEHPLYPQFREKLKSIRPVNPDYDPIKGNTEQWKAQSSMKKGFDLCLTILKIEGDKL